MRSIVRTAVGSKFQLAKAIGAPILPNANETLNEALNNSDAVPYQPAIPTAGMEVTDPYNYQTDSVNMRLQYIAIGPGGHYAVTNATHGIPTTQDKPHAALDTGLFKWMPFVVKPLTDDLTPDQRVNYRLRKVVTIGGTQYAAYFLRFIDLSTATITQNIVKKVKGVKTYTPYVATVQNLVPKDPDISGVNDGTSVETTVQVDITFDETQSQWLREAAALWYGDENAAIVSEIAFCSGVDKNVTKAYPATGNQVTQPVTTNTVEAVAVEMAIVESTYYPMVFNNGSVTERVFIGTEDALYGVNYNG